MAGHLTSEERERIRDLAASGMTRNDIVRETGRSPGTVSSVAKTYGLGFDRTAVKAATQAKAADLAARREAMRHRLMARAEHLMDQVESGAWQTIVKTTGGAETVELLGFVPVRDERDAAWSVGTYLANEERLAKSVTDAGVDAAKSVIGNVMDGLRALYQDSQSEPVPSET